MPAAPAHTTFPFYRRAGAGDPEDVRQQFEEWVCELDRCAREMVASEEERRGDMYLAARCLAGLETDLVGRDLAAEPSLENKLRMLDTAEAAAQATLACLADEVAQLHGPRADLRDRLGSSRRLLTRSSDTAKFWRLESRIGNLVAQQFYVKLLVKHYDLFRDLCDHADRDSSSSARSSRPPSFEDEPRNPAPPYALEREDEAGRAGSTRRSSASSSSTSRRASARRSMHSLGSSSAYWPARRSSSLAQL
ncbi:hypothetical protein JCM9279_002750 [Rhodotorula babjevae]